MKEIETSLLECEKFSFFCEERDEKRRKKQKWQPKTKKIQKKFCSLFALFFLRSLGRRPKHLHNLGHVHAHRYSIQRSKYITAQTA